MHALSPSSLSAWKQVEEPFQIRRLGADRQAGDIFSFKMAVGGGYGIDQIRVITKPKNSWDGNRKPSIYLKKNEDSDYCDPHEGIVSENNEDVWVVDPPQQQQGMLRQGFTEWSSHMERKTRRQTQVVETG